MCAIALFTSSGFDLARKTDDKGVLMAWLLLDKGGGQEVGSHVTGGVTRSLSLSSFASVEGSIANPIDARLASDLRRGSPSTRSIPLSGGLCC